jgi:hypothetical protein
MMISISTYLSETHNVMLKKKLIKELTEILIMEFWEKLAENIQNQLKEY